MVVGSVVGGEGGSEGVSEEEEEGGDGSDIKGADISADTGNSCIGSPAAPPPSRGNAGALGSPGTSRKAVVPAILLADLRKTSFRATKSVSHPICTIPTLLPPNSEIAITPSDVSLPLTFSAFFDVEAEVEESRYASAESRLLLDR